MPDRPAQVALPAQPTAFVGRADEVRLLEERLRQPEPRLLTLVGAAGTGKTRLAIEAALRAADRFPDGVFFVDLAPITDAALVPSTIALVVGLQQVPERSVLGQLAEYLAAHTVLLLLDNFEQLLPAAEQIAELLQLAS